MDAVLHHATTLAKVEIPPGFWEKLWDQGDAFFGAAAVVCIFGIFYLKVIRPDQKLESAARTERAKMELAEAIEKTKHQELASQMVQVQREIINKASDLLTRFEGNLNRHEEHIDALRGLRDQAPKFSPRGQKGG